MATNGVYAGSHFLEFISARLGFPIDQINFVFCQSLALLLGLVFRKYCVRAQVAISTRHLISIILGVILSWICFGSHMLHLIIQTSLCYVVLYMFADRPWCHGVVFVISMAYLSLGHAWRMVVDYYGYTLDITGPLMISTQKVSSIAFSVSDGRRLLKHRKLAGQADHNENQPDMSSCDSGVSQDQEDYAINAVPTPLEFYSYIFFFPAVLVGPLCFYNDYRKFMECDSLVGCQGKQIPPSCKKAVFEKLGTCVITVFIMLFIVKHLPITRNMDPEFIATSPLWLRFLYLLMSCNFARARYYFAWTLADAANNVSGLGFNGYHPQTGEAKWDLITNVNIVKLETATSWKMFIDNWNVQSSLWLRRVSYERLPPRYATFLTYILSSIWHGFYPGYYLLFITAAFLTLAARKMRRLLRPHFTTSTRRKQVYDALTFLAQNTLTCYTVTPFELMEGAGSLRFYRSMHFYGHILLLLVLVLVPNRQKEVDGKRK